MVRRILDQQGFTLIEVVLALTIISLFAAVFAPWVMSSVKRIQWAGERAQELLEQQGLMERRMAGKMADLKNREVPMLLLESGKLYKITGGVMETDDFVSFVAD